MTTALKAMKFAHEHHRDQRRKYTGAPYTDHLAEVVAIAVSVPHAIPADRVAAVAWLHDVIEDQDVAYEVIHREFGFMVAQAVWTLTDQEEGNRAERVKASLTRLANTAGWIQTIKVADIISNTKAAAVLPPKFAAMYLAEKTAQLDAMARANPELLAYARSVINDGHAHLGIGRAA
jgi:guanosine-3',5'-bis(diphosphate) 3'-pyrophosphohydrolase